MLLLRLFVTIIAHLLLTVISVLCDTDCNALTSLGDVTPTRIQTLVNSSFDLTCNLKSNHSSSDIVFHINNNIIDPKFVHILNEKSARLRLDHVQTNQTGRYWCAVRENGKKPFVCVSEVYIGYKPKDRPVTDYKCQLVYRNKLRCTFSYPANPIKTTYRVNMLYNALQGAPGFTQSCIPKSPKKGGRLECEFEDHSLTEFHFELLSNNSFGVNTQLFWMNLSSIVQLEAPKELSFNPLTNTIKWSYPNRIDSDRQLFRKLRFRLIVHPQDNFSDVTVFEYGHDTTSDHLNLKPYTKYCFNITCKIDDSINPYWSPWAFLKAKTAEAAPSAPPSTIKQAFETNSHVTIIYWKPLEERYRNSEHVYYKVQCFINGFRERCPIHTIDDTSVGLNVITNETSFKFTHHNRNEYRFHIYAANRNGTSAEYSEFYFPKVDHVFMFNHMIDISVHINDSTQDNLYRVDWIDPNSRVDNYTVFWCVQLGGVCSETLNWSFVPASVKTKTLKLQPKDYKFGVSLNYQNFTSGIIWTDCVIKYSGRLSKLYHYAVVPISPTTILVQWEFLCQAERSFVETLYLSYCQTSDCENTLENTIVNSKLNQYPISNLLPNTNYTFNVTSPSIISGRSLKARTEFDKPSPPFNATIMNQRFGQNNSNSVAFKWNYNDTMLEFFMIKFLDYNFSVSRNSCRTAIHVCYYTMEFDDDLFNYTDYTIHILACNVKLCTSMDLGFRTPAGRPGKMPPPKFRMISNNKGVIEIEKPSKPNGVIDAYYLWKSTDSNNPKRYDALGLKNITITERCLNWKKYTLKIAAANIVDGKELIGEYSDALQPELCNTNSFLLWIFLYLVCFTISITFVYVFYKFYYRFRLKERLFTPMVRIDDGDNAPDNDRNNFHHPPPPPTPPYDNVEQENLLEMRSLSNHDQNNRSRSSSYSSNSSLDRNFQENNQQSNPEYYKKTPSADFCEPLLSSTSLSDNSHNNTTPYRLDSLNSTPNQRSSASIERSPTDSMTSQFSQQSQPFGDQNGTLPISKSTPEHRQIKPESTNGYVKHEDMPYKLFISSPTRVN